MALSTNEIRSRLFGVSVEQLIDYLLLRAAFSADDGRLYIRAKEEAELGSIIAIQCVQRQSRTMRQWQCLNGRSSERHGPAYLQDWVKLADGPR